MENKKIIIIGAGLAGLAAANALRAKNMNVTILEARDRIGGRIHTDFSSGVPFDLGAFIIHGIEKNPIVTLAEQYHAKFSPITIDSIYFANRHKQYSEEELNQINTQFDTLLEDARDFAVKNNKDLSLSDAVKKIFSHDRYPLLDEKILGWRHLFLNLWTGANVNDLGAATWNIDERMLEGGNYLMMDGYQPIVNGLAKDLDIRLNTIVNKINYQQSEVIVETKKEIFKADAVIVTVPLGVLKANHIQFVPQLPSPKSAAIDRLEMGVLNKILLKFPTVFWPNKDGISYLQSHYDACGWFVNFARFFHEPILIASMGAEMARNIENDDDEATIDFVMQPLREFFKDKVEEPIFYQITRWGKDPFTLGSYSYIPNGASGKDLDVLAESVEQKIFFAGEATNKFFPGTVHGAYLSGLKAAEQIINLI